jgi:hypothetical protein
LGIAGVVEFGNEKAPWRYAGGLYEDIMKVKEIGRSV